MANRSHPFPGGPDAPVLIVQGEGVSPPKRTQTSIVPHPSTTLAQRQPGGRAHPVPGLNPMAPIIASDNRGKDTPTPAVHPGACGPMFARAGDNSVGARHTPELGDAVLAEAKCNTLIGSEKSHSMTGKKGG